MSEIGTIEWELERARDQIAALERDVEREEELVERLQYKLEQSEEDFFNAIHAPDLIARLIDGVPLEEAIIEQADKDADLGAKMRDAIATGKVGRIDRAAEANRARLVLLARYGLKMLDAHRNDGYPVDLDGDVAEDEAEKLGLLETQTRTMYCSEDGCACEHNGALGKWTCLFEAPWIDNFRKEFDDGNTEE